MLAKVILEANWLPDYKPILFKVTHTNGYMYDEHKTYIHTYIHY